MFIGRTDAETKPLILWSPVEKSQLIRKGWERLKAGEGDDRMRWLDGLNDHDFEQALGDSEGQGSLACCSPWGRKESDMTEPPPSSFRAPLTSTQHQLGLPDSPVRLLSVIHLHRCCLPPLKQDLRGRSRRVWSWHVPTSWGQPGSVGGSSWRERHSCGLQEVPAVHTDPGHLAQAPRRKPCAPGDGPR